MSHRWHRLRHPASPRHLRFPPHHLHFPPRRLRFPAATIRVNIKVTANATMEVLAPSSASACMELIAPTVLRALSRRRLPCCHPLHRFPAVMTAVCIETMTLAMMVDQAQNLRSAFTARTVQTAACVLSRQMFHPRRRMCRRLSSRHPGPRHLLRSRVTIAASGDKMVNATMEVLVRSSTSVCVEPTAPTVVRGLSRHHHHRCHPLLRFRAATTAVRFQEMAVVMMEAWARNLRYASMEPTAQTAACVPCHRTHRRHHLRLRRLL